MSELLWVSCPSTVHVKFFHNGLIICKCRGGEGEKGGRGGEGREGEGREGEGRGGEEGKEGEEGRRGGDGR